eukprot:TRINITY_DN3807_c0_g1_i1.p1 TRINITY_DN3807_c0_g1~~TRINITY_DN3807_c0_g1_i1.p1  ORF type:complete len:236 (+),score=70.50 TRINITY_DN3807_c0_g1_i1:302-1009(+)
MVKDEDNMFHVPNRCSTWKDVGLPTFKLDLEVDPLFHVNKFLDEIAQGNVQNSEKVLKELQSKLKLNNSPHSKASTEADLNASYTSEDYASQRSEIVLKAVDYLDDIDANPSLGCTERIKKEITTENRRLKKLNAHLDRKKKEMKEKEAKPLMCPKPTDSGVVDEKAGAEDSNIGNSEYQGSINEIMKTLLVMATGPNVDPESRPSNIVNKGRVEKVEKTKEKGSLWEGFLSLIK